MSGDIALFYGENKERFCHGVIATLDQQAEDEAYPLPLWASQARISIQVRACQGNYR
jgi:hypothetical protein